MLNIEDFAGSEGLSDIPIGLAKAAFVGWHAHIDWTIVILKWLFCEGRMRGMFSMLFGAGIILLTERIEQRAGSGRARAIYYRRNAWLLFFGLFHILTYGDPISLSAAASKRSDTDSVRPDRLAAGWNSNPHPLRACSRDSQPRRTVERGNGSWQKRIAGTAGAPYRLST
jgi:hypothetical protein